MRPGTPALATALVLAVASWACREGGERDMGGSETALGGTAGATAIGERYVRLVLALGEHDADYVDAYYGPPTWRVRGEKRPLTALEADARRLQRDLEAQEPPATAEEVVRLRHQYLRRQLAALQARLSMLQGATLSFDDESRALYDAVAPVRQERDFAAALAEVEALLPGPGTLADRYAAFRSRFVIPRERLDATFRSAIAACRARTLEHVTLPPEERFTVEYVTGKSWSGYNWYQGDYRSIIQVNTDLPVYADRAIDLACHEGYPGHHVYNVLLEQHLVRGRGWPEFSVYPLFSPQSLIAEGTANYGIEIAFSPAERLDVERRVVFPAAGLNPADAETYYAVVGAVDRLAYAGNEAARRYLNGEIDAAGAAAYLVRWGLYAPARAQQRVRFIEQYRSYVINYNLGKDLVADYVNRVAGSPDPGLRWKAFVALLSSPRLPSGLGPAGAGREGDVDGHAVR